MTTDPNDERHRVALFRYGVIADLIHLPKGAPGLYAKLEAKAEQDYDIPGTLRTRVAAETMRGWLRDYRKGGFDALLPKTRSDVGCSRSIPPDVADILVALKDDNAELSVPLVIKAARETGQVPDDLELPTSTVHRLLTRHGVMRRSDETGATKDRRRFAYEHAGELWMSDVMHGPAVRTERRRKRKTYLIAFIDDATRVIPYAEFALSENTLAFMPVLEQAILRRGFPKRLFVDNGAAYRSKHLALVAAKLGITLVHARARDAAAKGKIERWFRTVRMQLLTRLTPADLDSLDALNRRLRLWVEEEYHHNPHRGLDRETPLDRWAQRAGDVRYPSPQDNLRDLFLFEARRKVHKDRTVSLEGDIYEVDATLVGQTVQLRYDPRRRRRGIQVWHDGQHVHDARLVDTRANCHVRRDRGPEGLDLTSLADKEDR